jgi:hypothetical protein
MDACGNVISVRAESQNTVHKSSGPLFSYKNPTNLTLGTSALDPIQQIDVG